jgi:NAD(P)-dependent dehydrogenase (short-subunit alcohol dehydrogenase family)
MSNQVAVPAVADLLSLEGQRALVTGASGNIGHGIAVRLAEAGADVIVHYVNDADGAARTIAAGFPVQMFADMSAIEWQQVVAANLDSAVNVSREAIRRMCGQDSGGTIVNIASIEGTDPAMGHSHYATSKAGLLMLTRSLTLEYAGKGIRVNAKNGRHDRCRRRSAVPAQSGIPLDQRR